MRGFWLYNISMIILWKNIIIESVDRINHKLFISKFTVNLYTNLLYIGRIVAAACFCLPWSLLVNFASIMIEIIITLKIRYTLLKFIALKSLNKSEFESTRLHHHGEKTRTDCPVRRIHRMMLQQEHFLYNNCSNYYYKHEHERSARELLIYQQGNIPIGKCFSMELQFDTPCYLSHLLYVFKLLGIYIYIYVAWTSVGNRI